MRELPANRLASLDAYRGFVMFLLLAQALQLPAVAAKFPDDPAWQWVKFHTSHVEWAGCSLHDLIQPSFTFLVGVALPFSLANRIERGQSAGRAAAHALWRAVVLVLLGVFLRSTGRPQTNWTFEDTLSQIGLGYFPLFLIGLGPRWLAWAALALVLGGYTAAFAAYPLPPPGFDYAAVGVPADWQHHYPPDTWAGHWNKNSNAAWAFDRWFLNLFPRPEPFAFHAGGYATLSFVPTLGTMLLGLIAGRWLLSIARPWAVVGVLALAGGVLLGLGLAADRYGVVPSVKRIWTPAWVLESGGWCFLILAAFYAVIDAAGLKAWSLPLRVIGLNSIAAYCMAGLLRPFLAASLKTHLSERPFGVLGPEYAPLLLGAAVVLIEFGVLVWMYRRGIFLRV